MRLPVVGNISTKDGASNKNARMVNVLAEEKKDKTIAAVRPGLNQLATGSGDGNNLVCFDGELINIYGQGINRAVDAVTTAIGSFTPPTGSWSYYSAYDIAGNGSIFCIVPRASAATSAFFTSTDGITWTQRDNSAGGFAQTFYQIIWDGLMFVAIGDDSFSSYFLSSDGINWNRYAISGAPISNTTAYFNYCNGLYCFSDFTTTAVTADFVNWSSGTSPYQMFAIGVTNTAFIGVIFNSSKALRSTNGTSWETTDMPTTAQWVSSAFNGEVVCVVAINSTTCAVSTDDGATWVGGTLPSTGYVSITSSDGKFVAAKNGAIATSQDGITWVEKATSFTKLPTYRGAANGNKFCFGEHSVSTTTPSTLVVDYGFSLQSIGTVGSDFHDFALIP